MSDLTSMSMQHDQANERPESLVQAQAIAGKTIAEARHNLHGMLTVSDGWSRFSLATIASLRVHAQTVPNARALADFLCDMVPMQFMSAEFTESQADGPDGVGVDDRMRKLHSAVIEAGLAEQLHADGTLREGVAFSAALLERSLDDWLCSGQHRGAEFDDSPLTQIDRLITRQCVLPEDGVSIRFGLLTPVVMSVHIWRTVEQYPAEIAQKIGWLAAADDTTEAAASWPHLSMTSKQP